MQPGCSTGKFIACKNIKLILFCVHIFLKFKSPFEKKISTDALSQPDPFRTCLEGAGTLTEPS